MQLFISILKSAVTKAIDWVEYIKSFGNFLNWTFDCWGFSLHYCRVFGLCKLTWRKPTQAQGEAVNYT